MVSLVQNYCLFAALQGDFSDLSGENPYDFSFFM